MSTTTTADDNSNNVNKLLAEFISETVAKPPEEQAKSESLLANLVKNLGDPNETNEEKEKFVASANQVADSVYPSLIREIIENSKKDDAGKAADPNTESQAVSPDIQDKVDQVNAVLDEGLERHFRNELDNDSILNIVKKAIEKSNESEPKPQELTPLELDLIKNRLRNLINNIKPKILELYEKSKQEENEKEEAKKKEEDEKKPIEPAAPSPDQTEPNKPKEEKSEAKKEVPEVKPDQSNDVAKPEPVSQEKKDSPKQEDAKTDAPANPEPSPKKHDKPTKDDSKKDEKGSDGKEVAKKEKNGDEPTVIKLVLRIFIKGLDTSKFKPVVSVSSPSKADVASKKPSSSDKSSSSHKKHRDSSDKPKESANKEDKPSKPKDQTKSSSSGRSGDDGKTKRSCKVEQSAPVVAEKKKSCEKKSESSKSETSSSSQKRSSRSAAPGQLPKEYLNIIYSQFDQDKDKYVSADDLAKTLANVYSLPKFDQEAAEALVNKYDQNKDNKIDVSEFFPLFEGIGALHKEFLDTDYANDANGLLDAKELAQVFKKRGRKDEQLSAELFHWIVLEVSKQPDGKVVPTNGLKFDKFVRVVEQFDELVKQFKQSENK